jgi:lysophospholipase L1-like esterase
VTVVALGTNDLQSTNVRRDYAELISQLKPLAPVILAIGVPPMKGADSVNKEVRLAASEAGIAFVDMPMPADGSMDDGIHLNAAGYRIWIPTIIRAITSSGQTATGPVQTGGVVR